MNTAFVCPVIEGLIVYSSLKCLRFVLLEFINLHDLFVLQVIACLDVRSNDKGDLVVTKGDQYDVRERTNENEVWIYSPSGGLMG